MQRELMQELINWRHQEVHLPILLRGARQVGKSFLVEAFAKQYFDDFVEINFEAEPAYSSCFEALKPKEIINRIEILGDVKITPEKTLLFLDEIQNCPNAIVALRYFREKMPALHVIAAGSLLEFALGEESISMPVGRIQYLYMKPLSFREFLTAKDAGAQIDYIKSVKTDSEIYPEVHDKLLKDVREYMNIGGMPLVMNRYLLDGSMRDCQNYQTLILRTYSDDFRKYVPKVKHKYLQMVFDKTPGMVGKQIQYSKISPEMKSMYLKEAIGELGKAGVMMPVYSTSGAGIPLSTYVNEKRYKLLFLDVGLVKRATKLDIELLFTEDLMLLNQGAIAEQFVGQELLAYQDPYYEASIYYWAREKKSSKAEVDYIISIDQHVIPIEVKAGKIGSLKSLQLFMNEHNSQLGIRISAKSFGMRGNILSLPFYMISEMPRLVRELL